MRLLRQDGDPLAELRPGFTRRFSIYDDDDQLAIVKTAYRGLGLDEKEFLQYRAAISRISQSKNLKLTPEDLYKKAINTEGEKLAAVFEHYEKALHAANALDFDDLLLEAVRLLRHDAPTREAWNRRLSYVMVDEYQDTNRSQYELMRLLSEAHRNVCVVGDEDQSIYSWRGADIRNILDFEHDFPKRPHHPAGAELPLHQEHSGRGRRGGGEQQSAQGQEAVDRSAAADERDRTLRRPSTPKTKRCSWPTSIEKYLAADPQDHAAVLYRTNFQSRQIEEALRRYGRKYNIVGGFSFYQRAEIKDVVAYLKLAASNTDSASLLRVINTPARGIGRTTVEQIEKYARENGIKPVGRDRADRGWTRQLSTRSQSSLVTFRNLIQELSLVASASPLPDLIRFILDRTGYRRMLGAGAHARIGNAAGRTWTS